MRKITRMRVIVINAICKRILIKTIAAATRKITKKTTTKKRMRTTTTMLTNPTSVLTKKTTRNIWLKIDYISKYCYEGKNCFFNTKTGSKEKAGELFYKPIESPNYTADFSFNTLNQIGLKKDKHSTSFLAESNQPQVNFLKMIYLLVINNLKLWLTSRRWVWEERRQIPFIRTSTFWRNTLICWSNRTRVPSLNTPQYLK